MLRVLSVLFVATLFLVATAPQMALAKPSDPGKFVEEVSDDVLDMVRDVRGMENAEETLQIKLRTTLEPYIDFETFARGVMGKYRDEVEQSKKDAFTTDFKNTLVKLYAKSMLAFEVKDITIAETVKPRPNMAQVTMHITSAEDASFQAQYSLRQNAEGEWKVLNVILDGVNLGLTYRNQFYSAVDSNNGNVVAAIENWSQVMRNVDAPGTNGDEKKN